MASMQAMAVAVEWSRSLRSWLPTLRGDRRLAWRWSFGVGALLWLAYVLVCWLRPGGEVMAKDVANIFNCSASLSAALCCAACAASRQNGSDLWRRGWAYLSVGWAFNFLGEVQWLLVETMQRREVPSPGIADLFFELSYPGLLAGLCCFFLGVSQVKRALAALDSALVASAFGALAWFFVLRPVWMGRDPNAPLSTWLSVSYPFFDIGIAWAALALCRHRSYGPLQRRIVGGLVVLMGLYAVTDLLYAYEEVNNTYQSGNWNDVLNGSVYLGVALHALLTLWHQPTSIDAPSTSQIESPDLANGAIAHGATDLAHGATDTEKVSLWRALSPYAFTIVVLVTVSLQQWQAVGGLSVDVLLWGLVFLAVVLLRQMVSISENLRLSRALGDLNTGLDSQVQTRTRQLDALLQLTQAVNSSLLEADVLQQAALSARRAVEADAVGVWLWQSHQVGSNGELPDRREIGDEGDAREVTLAAFDENLPGSNLERVFQSCGARVMARRVAASGHEEHCSEIGFCCGETLPAEPGADFEQNHPQELETAGACHSDLHLHPVRYGDHVLGVLGALRLAPSGAAVPLSPDEARLLHSVALEIGTALENARTYSRAVDAADLDPVTGLLNHRAMQGRFEAAWRGAQQKPAPLSVVMMDLDNFKGFNDTYGHLAGDEVLRLVAGALERACRAGDFVARYGGDEFFMLLPNTNAPGALQVAERLQQSMLGIEFRPAGNAQSLPIALSFGVATSPTDARTKVELLSLADRNLYLAKGSQQSIRGTSETARAGRDLISNGGIADQGIATLDAMVTAISNFDHYTRQHSEDVTEYALWIAEELGFGAETQRTIRVGGMLHDVGKICVPQDVLKKPGGLSDEEFAAMKTHPAQGALLVGAMLCDADVLDIVRCHHERFDGRGYPDGLRGEAIPLLGRVVAVADAFSAMTTSRPYRRALSRAQGREEIEKNSGIQFDPHFVAAFLRALDKREG